MLTAVRHIKVCSRDTKSPEFNCDMLLMRSGNWVLLQKRPSKAIWGGHEDQNQCEFAEIVPMSAKSPPDIARLLTS